MVEKLADYHRIMAKCRNFTLYAQGRWKRGMYVAIIL